MIEPGLTSGRLASLDNLTQDDINELDSRLADLPAVVKSAIGSQDCRELSASLQTVLYFSPFIERVCRRYPDQISTVIGSGQLASAYREGQLIEKVISITKQCSEQAEFDRLLRIQRNIELARIAWREYSGLSGLEQSIRELSELADACLRVSVDWHTARLVEIHGCPLAAKSGEIADFIVFALGKLGGGELNFSSDIDLVFAYTQSGQTDGRKPLSNHEFFIKLGRMVIHTLGNITEDGFVYRVDMRLRPNGHSGQLAMSFSAMENYYQIHGREWERYAWIKSRPVAGNMERGAEFLSRLRPFIYRKYLDYQVYRSLEEMKSMINKEIRQTGMQNNIKLGRGGIREIEFIVQSHQLVRGGRDPDLRTRSLKSALHTLASNGQLESDHADKLYMSYTFLRNVEHRLQMPNDEQLHALPTDDDELDKLAAGITMTRVEFQHEMEAVRNFVHRQFILLHSGERQTQAGNDWLLLWNGAVNQQGGSANLYRNDDYSTALEYYVNSKAYRSLETRARRILDSLVPKLLHETAEQHRPGQTLDRCLKVITSIGGRTAYLDLLDQFPAALKQLVTLCTASPWISQWIADHPIVLDTLINPRTDFYTFNQPDFEPALEKRLTAEDDVELKHDLLRQMHHTCLLQVAIADLQAQYTVFEIRKIITLVAEVIIRQVVYLCQSELEIKFGHPQGGNVRESLGVIAYGKLGSGELSYNADLDLVFVYDDDVLGNETKGGRRSVRIDYYFSRLVQRIVTMLGMQTSAGKLYDVDTRLRPSGRSGLLITSLSSYDKYQREQAWTWEHQALIKARLISPGAHMQTKFENIRNSVLGERRNSPRLVEEIVSMRERMHSRGSHDRAVTYKYAPGGMVDIEFLCQFLVLQHAHEYRQILDCRSVIEILEFSGSTGAIDTAHAEVLIRAWKNLLELENRIKLSGETIENPAEPLQTSMDRVWHVWQQILA